MTSLPEPDRPTRITVTPQRVEDLRRLAANAEGFALRAEEAGDDAHAVSYSAGVIDALRWLGGDGPAPYLTEVLAD